MESSHAADHTECKKLKPLAEIAADIFRDLSPTPEVAENRSIATDGTSGLYTPLQEGQIRLLSIIPSEEFDAPLICTLRPVTLSKARYAAISYVWGDPSNPEEASINGHMVLLQRNLASALRHIRATGASEVCGALWADAICINQHDIPEKNQQVGMMDRVYPCATLVIAWLGTARPNITAAFKSIVNISAVVEDLETSAEKISLLGREFEWSGGKPDSETSWSRGPGPWRGLRLFHEHEYWTRGWIFQELQLSKELVFMCGQDVITALQLQIVYETMDGIEKRERFYFSIALNESWPKFEIIRSKGNFSLTGSQASRSDQMNNFHRLLCLTQDLRVSNPSDKIYTLLTITGLQNIIKPDYSIPTRSLYISICDLLLKNKVDLSFLAMGRMPTLDHQLAVDPQMPSWLPNLYAVSEAAGNIPNFDRFLAGDYKAAASLNGKPQILASSCGQYLAVDGYVIDTVEALHTDTSHSNLFDVMEHVMFICGSLKREESMLPLLQAACRTLTSDSIDASRITTFDTETLVTLGVTFLDMLRYWHRQCLREHTNPSEHQQKFIAFCNSFRLDPWNYENFVEVVCKHFLGSASELIHWTSERICSGLYRSPDERPREYKALQLLKRIYACMIWRSTIRSSKLHFGNAPLDTQVGDQICIFKGCSFPVILRKQPEYVYVGPCFLLGFMDGEIVSMSERGELQEEHFEIF